MENDYTDIGALCDYIVSSDIFGRSPKKRKIFQYLVQEELAGRGENIKEYNIAIDALDYSDTFDPQIDSTIRTEMYRIRKDLAGASDILSEFSARISFEKGSYRPIFSYPVKNHAPKRNIILLAIGASLFIPILVVAVIFVLAFSNARKSELAVLNCPSNIPLFQMDIIAEKTATKEVMNFFKFFEIAQNQYSYAHQVQGRCKSIGSPYYIVQLKPHQSRESNSVDITLAYQGSEYVGQGQGYKTIYMRNVNLEKGERDAKYLAAEEAWNIFHKSGILAVAALSENWGDERKKSDYSCIVNYGFYRLNSVNTDAQKLLECLILANENDGRNVSIKGILALEMLLIKREMSEAYIDKPLEQASLHLRDGEKLEHKDADLLIGRLRWEGLQKEINVPAIKQLEKIVKSHQNLNPEVTLVLSQVMGFNAGEWSAAGKYSKQTQKILPDLLPVLKYVDAAEALMNLSPEKASEEIKKIKGVEEKLAYMMLYLNLTQINDKDEALKMKSKLFALGIKSHSDIVEHFDEVSFDEAFETAIIEGTVGF